MHVYGGVAGSSVSWQRGPGRRPEVIPGRTAKEKRRKTKKPQVGDLRLLKFSEGDGTRTRNHRIDSFAIADNSNSSLVQHFKAKSESANGFRSYVIPRHSLLIGVDPPRLAGL
ncbi:MAG TPA: hypothetical protein VG826_20360 [Pirellulales bacterium]|nr:hypothetical protein [Pirellulales bacterium]